MILLTISVAIVILGIAFVVGEIESEEVNFFGPLALICMILGPVLWFASNPLNSLKSIELFVELTIILLSVAIVLSGFSVFIMVKMVRIRKNPTIEEEFVGDLGKVVKSISKSNEGYIKYKEELWKALSNVEIAPEQEVKVIKKKGLVLFVEPLKDNNLKLCPNCGEKLSEETIVCCKCGSDL
ncbi:MAG: NfeD family protein [Promethearchaeota archaeon]